MISLDALSGLGDDDMINLEATDSEILAAMGMPNDDGDSSSDFNEEEKEILAKAKEKKEAKREKNEKELPPK